MREPEILRVRDLTALLGVARSTIWKWTKDGAFPAPVRLGGQTSRMIGWRRSDVEAWIRSRPAA